MPIREGSVEVNSSNAIKGAVYIGRHALVLGHIVAASAQGGLPSFLERLPEQPMASSLLEELKTVATEVERPNRECSGQFVGNPGDGRQLAMEWDRDSIGSNGSRRRKGARRGTGRTGAGGRGRAGGLNSKNNGRILWQPSLIGRTS